MTALLVLAAQERIDFRTFMFANVGVDLDMIATAPHGGSPGRYVPAGAQTSNRTLPLPVGRPGERVPPAPAPWALSQRIPTAVTVPARRVARTANCDDSGRGRDLNEGDVQ